MSQTSGAQNPLTGAGIIRYFDVEKGIKVAPQVILGVAVVFIIFEIVLKMIG